MQKLKTRTVGYAELSSTGLSLRIRLQDNPDYFYINIKTIKEILNHNNSKSATVFTITDLKQ